MDGIDLLEAVVTLMALDHLMIKNLTMPLRFRHSISVTFTPRPLGYY